MSGVPGNKLVTRQNQYVWRILCREFRDAIPPPNQCHIVCFRKRTRAYRRAIKAEQLERAIKDGSSLFMKQLYSFDYVFEHNQQLLKNAFSLSFYSPLYSSVLQTDRIRARVLRFVHTVEMLQEIEESNTKNKINAALDQFYFKNLYLTPAMVSWMGKKSVHDFLRRSGPSRPNARAIVKAFGNLHGFEDILYKVRLPSVLEHMRYDAMVKANPGLDLKGQLVLRAGFEKAHGKRYQLPRNCKKLRVD